MTEPGKHEDPEKNLERDEKAAEGAGEQAPLRQDIRAHHAAAQGRPGPG
jgi:hypothetical protein